MRSCRNYALNIIIIALLRAKRKFEACKISVNAHVNANLCSHELSLHCHVRSMLFPFSSDSLLLNKSCPNYKRNIKTSFDDTWINFSHVLCFIVAVTYRTTGFKFIRAVHMSHHHHKFNAVDIQCKSRLALFKVISLWSLLLRGEINRVSFMAIKCLFNHEYVAKYFFAAFYELHRSLFYVEMFKL